MIGHIVIEGLNTESNTIINNAIELSLHDDCENVSTVHVLTRLFDIDRIERMFTDCTGVTPDAVYDKYDDMIDKGEDKFDGDIKVADVSISNDLNSVLANCVHVYRVTGRLVTPEILIYYMLKLTGNPAYSMLASMNVDIADAVRKFKLLADVSMYNEEDEAFDLDEVERTDEKKEFIGNHRDFMDKIADELSNIFENMGIPGVKLQRLEQMDNNKYEKNNEIMPLGLINLIDDIEYLNTKTLINRDDEILDIVETLSKKNSANVLLVGEPGVGKTAIAHGLVHKIKNNELNIKVGGVYELRVDILLQNSCMRGELESRMEDVIEFCKQKNALLVIDEFHSITRLGSVEGSVPPITILKPYLEKGEIRMIGMTTHNEFKKYVEKDQALCRRFKVLEVREPNVNDTINIVYNARSKYVEFHDCSITKEQVKTIVTLADRYITNRHFPDKAFAVMDEAMAVAKISSRNKVSTNDIKYVVSKISGVPVGDMSKSEIEKVSNLENTFKKQIIGQDRAIDIVCKAVKRGKAGINDPDKPVASFLFVGPTGVGKTELCKVLSQHYGISGTNNSLIRLDMSEFAEKHSVSKLFGAPPGYVGYEEGGGLTERVKHSPYSVILFDEIEKAHPEVFNSMLQILDAGEMTDGKGTKVNFRNCIVVMTSNAGYGADALGNKKVGFSTSSDNIENNDMELKAMKALEETFKPEFLNRIDNIVIFDKLTKEHSKEIVKILLSKLKDRAIEKGIKITFDDNVIELIVKKGFDDKYNARNLRRTIQNIVENRIANEIIDGNIKKGSKVEINASEVDEIILKVS